RCPWTTRTHVKVFYRNDFLGFAMKQKIKKWAGVLLAGATAFALVSAMTTPANANTTSPAPANNWVLGYTDSNTTTPDFASVGDVINSTHLNLHFTGTYGGNPATVDCNNVSTT